MHRIWFWVFLIIATLIVTVFHTKVHRYNAANRNLIISSMYKDVWPYWLAWGVIVLFFLFLFFCYKPIVLPEIEYVDRIKLKTVDNHLENSLGLDLCLKKADINKLSCTEEEKLYGCDDSPDCDGNGCSGIICGIFDTIISSGSVLPTSGEAHIGTLKNRQTSMTFDIYQGENIIAQRNTLLQSGIIINNLPNKLAGEAGVDVSFNIDKNGYLSFKAIDKDNPNNVKQTTIQIPNNGYEIVPKGNISMFELIKRELGRLFR